MEENGNDILKKRRRWYEVLKKIYQELVEIRKELQAIKSSYIERKGVIPLLPECEVSWSGEPGTLGHTESTEEIHQNLESEKKIR